CECAPCDPCPCDHACPVGVHPGTPLLGSGLTSDVPEPEPRETREHGEGREPEHVTRTGDGRHGARSEEERPHAEDDREKDLHAEPLSPDNACVTMPGCLLTVSQPYWTHEHTQDD